MKVEFSAKQKEMLRLPARTWNIFGGAVRSGKSHGTLYRLPVNIAEHYADPCLICGKTLATIEKNVLRPARKIYGAYDVGEIKSRQDGGRYATLWGKEVDCVGANDERAVTKIHGTEYGFAYCDEIALYPENFFRLLTSRLSLPNSICDATCNPESPSHFLKVFIDRPDFAGNYMHFTIYDNPFLPREYVSRLESEYRGTIYFDRWILGKWVRTEGLVFPLFKRERHLQTPDAFFHSTGLNARDIRYLIVGGDGATTNDATALVPLAIFSDGTCAVLDIFYHDPKANGQLSNAELLPHVARWFDAVISKYKLDQHGVRVYTAIDCASADLVLTLRKNLPQNYNITAMTKKSIMQTVDVTNNAFARDAIRILDFGGTYNYVRSRQEIGVNPLVKELETIVWKEGNEVFDPKIPNDVADAFRYAVNTYYNNPENLWATPNFEV